MERGKRMEYVNSTAGAVPIVNKKGEVSMKKVKVNRYISGKRPDFAEETISSSSENEDEKFVKPSFISTFGGGMLGDLKTIKEEFTNLKVEVKTEVEEDEEELYQRRQQLRKKILEKEEVKEEYEFETESESEEEEEVVVEKVTLPKAVFVSRKDRATLREIEERKELESKLEKEREITAAEQRQVTLKMIEEENKLGPTVRSTMPGVYEICSEDEDDEVAYECWKIRELKRLKTDREEYDRYLTEKAETERIHGLTDEQRAAEFKLSGGKITTNKKISGNMKFLQKYFHRGAFYLDKDDEVFKRDFNQPTLEDHFDKTILPAVMQVKDFGLAGRTKYTHLVDQDTSMFIDSPWGDESKGGVNPRGGIGGIKNREVFERPSAKKQKKN